MEEQMPLSEERMTRIQLEETLERMPRTPDLDDEERSFREGIAEDIAMMKKAGVEIAFPSTQPDLSE